MEATNSLGLAAQSKCLHGGREYVARNAVRKERTLLDANYENSK